MKLLSELREKQDAGASVASEASIICSRTAILDKIGDAELADVCGGIPRLIDILEAAERAAVAMRLDLVAYAKRAPSAADFDAAESLICKYGSGVSVLRARIVHLRAQLPPPPSSKIVVRPVQPLSGRASVSRSVAEPLN